MTDKISPATVRALSETMLIPLWAKAVEQQRPQPLLKDAEAPRMLAMIDYDFDRFKGARMSQPGCCGRAALIDDEVQAFIRQHPDAVVAQIGAGIDARFERLGRPAITAWVDMDLPEVIALRRRLLPASTNIYLEGSLLDEGWTATLAAYGKPVLLVLEGVLMYFDQAQVQAFFAMLTRRLPGVTVVFDMLPPFVLKHDKHHDALKRMGGSAPSFQWALREPRDMEGWQPGLRVQVTGHLSERCGKRYPWLLRMIYRTNWGRQNMDQRIIRVEVGAIPIEALNRGLGLSETPA